MRVFKPLGLSLMALGLALPLAASAEELPAGLAGLVGTVFEGPLPIAGWEEQGGGLLSEPVWFSDYGRADGARLVLALWSLPRAPGADFATFQVTDLAVIEPPPPGYELAFLCEGPQVNVTRSLIAVARADYNAERWSDLTAAWKVDHLTGQIDPIATEGISCINEGSGV